MLTSLSVQNYTIVEKLALDFTGGMTVITGETGAGKSIMLDALDLALGGRADAGVVRPGTERADIIASFDLRHSTAARAWLAEHELDDGEDCLLRRTLSSEGRSRAFINGRPCAVNDLRALGALLVDIHSQHEHQSLLRRDTHRLLLDQFASATEQAATTARLARDWQRQHEQLARLRDSSRDTRARQQLLTFQLEELRALALAPGDVEQLEAEQRKLANAGEILQGSHTALDLCRDSDDANALALLTQALQRLEPQADHHPALREAVDLLTSAQVQVEDAARVLQRHVDHFELDPERLQEVDERLAAIFQLARKHKIPARELHQLTASLEEELQGVDASDERLDALQQALEATEQAWRQSAEALSRLRARAAERLARDVMAQLSALGMAQCRLQLALTPRADQAPHPHGREEVEILVSTNPGQPAGPLARIASGGELSRLSLAIQVVAAQVSTVPTLVFDEVDVGIGGRIADVVGTLLRQLGQQGQVLCVTHLPQVAAKGHHHLRVEKLTRRDSTHTRMEPLEGEARVEEIARMLGGVKITAQTRAHAQEMLTMNVIE